jgi:hypothetical protein
MIQQGRTVFPDTDNISSQYICSAAGRCQNEKCRHRVPHNDDTCFLQPDVFYCPHVDNAPTQCKPTHDPEPMKIELVREKEKK